MIFETYWYSFLVLVLVLMLVLVLVVQCSMLEVPFNRQ